MATLMDEPPIGLQGIHADSNMKIVQADQRSSYINAVVLVHILAPGRKVRQDPIS